MITDAFEGVCCKFLQKLCYRVKKCKIKYQEVMKVRYTTYEGWVSSNY